MNSQKPGGRIGVKIDKKHECYVCHNIFTCERNLTRHCISVHEVDKPYQCAKCFDTFRSRKKLQYHSREKHEISKNDEFHYSSKTYWNKSFKFVLIFTKFCTLIQIRFYANFVQPQGAQKLTIFKVESTNEYVAFLSKVV